MTAGVTTLSHYIDAPAIISSATESEYVSPGFKTVVEMRDLATTADQQDSFAPHFSRIQQLLEDEDAYEEGQESPSKLSATWARFILQKFQAVGLPPDRILASAEGGIGICFAEGEKYSDIECLNSGVILGVTSDRRSRPMVWEIEQTPRGAVHAAQKIAEFLHRY